MARSPLVLAALLSAALPSAHPVSAVMLPATGHGEGLDSAAIEDRQGRHWEVRAPATDAGGAALERELAVLSALSSLVQRPGRPPRLPFAVQQVAASLSLDEGGRVVVLTALPGTPLDLAAVADPASLGRALAAVHELPPTLLEDAGAPVLTAEEVRERRLGDLDRAAATGLVPTVLLSRWENGLEKVGHWRFTPTAVHGDLAAEDVLVSPEGVVTGVLGWGGAQVADPADDLAVLAAGAPAEVLDAVVAAYAGARTGRVDEHLAERARLVSELALASYLLHGVRRGDQDVVDDAHAMLEDLEAATPVGGA